MGSSLRVSLSCAIYWDGYPGEFEAAVDNFNIFFEKCEAAGVDVLLLLAYGSESLYVNTYELTNCSTSQPDGGILYKFPPQERVWRNYVNEMMKQFGDRISGVEVWNEPDHFGDKNENVIDDYFFYGRVEDYKTLFRTAHEEIKAYDRSMPVCIGGLACMRPIYRSYLESLINPVDGIFDILDDSDAMGLHCYNGTALERLRIYHEVCEQYQRNPVTVWVTEFGRTFDDGRKVWTSGGARAYADQIVELFSAYSVDRAYWYCDVCQDDDNSFKLFSWDQVNLIPTEKWEYYQAAATGHLDYQIKPRIGFGQFDGWDLDGIRPFEDYSHFDLAIGVPYEVQSTFTYDDSGASPILLSVTHEGPGPMGQELPISFDVNDEWVRKFESADIFIEIDYRSPNGPLELRYQLCCETEFLLGRLDQKSIDFYYELFCPGFLDGLYVEEIVPDFEVGVGYQNYTASHVLPQTEPGVVSTVLVAVDDWLFNNGVEKRADFQIIPLDSSPFEIHGVRIWPKRGGVVYEDKSSETQMVLQGQPRNGSAFDGDGDSVKDLLVTHFDNRAQAFLSHSTGVSGAPRMEDETPGEFPFLDEPYADTDGAIFADFDNDGFVDFMAPNHFAGGRLFKNINGSHYEDWTVESGLSAVADLSTAFSCSWGDLNADGFPELVVVCARNPFEIGIEWNDVTIYHNSGGTFDYAIPGYHGAGNSPIWADFDNDGDLDLLSLGSEATPLCCDPPAGLNVYNENQGNGIFVVHYLSPHIVNYGYGGTIYSPLDYDNDGDIDVVGADESCVYLLENIYDNKGGFRLRPHLPIVSSFGYTRPVDLTVCDFDLDGHQDIVAIYGDVNNYVNGSEVFLLKNMGPEGIFQEVGDDLDHTGVVKTAGMAIADYNKDGYSDIFLSRYSNNSFFYKAKTDEGFAQNNWLGVSVRANNPYACSDGLGARVEISYGGNHQTRIIDGGSGLSGQQATDLVFGLGDFFGEVEIGITWPNGYFQSCSIGELNAYVTIWNDIPVVDNSSVGFSRVFHVDSGLTDWAFSWETNGEGLLSLDQVILDLADVPRGCKPRHSVLTSEMEEVDVTVSEVIPGRFLHTMTYTGVECVPRCSIPYQVRSGQPGYISESAFQVLDIMMCLISK